MKGPVALRQCAHRIGIGCLAELVGKRDLELAFHRFFGIADHHEASGDPVGPEAREEECLIACAFILCKEALLLPVQHPGIRIEDRSVEDHDVVHVSVCKVDQMRKRVEPCPDVVERGGARNMADHLGAFLRPQDTKVVTAEEFVEFRDRRRLSGRWRAGKFDDERSRKMRLVVSAIGAEKAMDAFRRSLKVVVSFRHDASLG